MKGIFQRGDSFQVKKRFPGVEKRVSATFGSLEAAQAFIRECEAAIARGDPLPNSRGATSTTGADANTLEAIFNEVRSVRWASNRSDASEQNARQFCAWAGWKRPPRETLTPATVNEYVRYRRKLGNGPDTINKKLSAISVLLDQAVDLEKVPGKFKIPYQSSGGGGRDRYFTQEEEAEIVRWSRTLGLDEWADLWIFLADTGARPPVEVKRLKWGDFRERSVMLETAKRKDAKKVIRAVPLTSRALAAVERRRQDPNLGHLPGPFSWASGRKLTYNWNKLREYIPWLRASDTVPYTFRHTCASRHMMAGAHPVSVMRWMGHSNINTTMRYSHLAPGTLNPLASGLENFTDPKSA